MTAKPRISNRAKEILAELRNLGLGIKGVPWLEVDSDGIHQDLIIARNAIKAARVKLEKHRVRNTNDRSSRQG